MRIEYICHSCLYIDTGDTSLVFDPWFNGPAYSNQWFVFPKPVDTSMLHNVRNILITHGHEDHLHEPTLQTLPKNAQVFYPYQWRGSAKKWFSKIGFEKVTEAVSFHKYRISSSTEITYIGFALESIVVIECNGTVIINLNDALNSHHQNVVNVFIEKIKERWKKIDFLFSGWSGAGYFPNTVHYKLKDDVEVGKIREQYFANHFCKIIKALNPRIAIPFAPGFVLLAPDKRWINEIKFPREILEYYYKKYFDKHTATCFEIMHAGDYFEDDMLKKVSPYYHLIKNNSLNHLIDQDYAEEIEEAKAICFVDESTAGEILNKLDVYVNDNTKLYAEEVLQEAVFSVFINDLHRKNYFNVEYTDRQFKVYITDQMPAERKLLLRTNSKLLLYALDHEWGGDSLTIGYGIDVDVFDESALEKNLDIICVRLITRYPTASENLRRQPLRAMKYFFTNPHLAKLAVRQKLMMRKTVNKFPYNERDHWISFTKCELCRVCNMPLLSFEFGEQLASANEKKNLRAEMTLDF